jgi:GT2 family glycosyltransferase/glycosyltransferase involved in cell wall biosynthesis/SAM-dependent methyltransferase
MNKKKELEAENLPRRFADPEHKLAFTGERYVSGHLGPTQHAHHHRYLFALDLCKGRRVLDIASGEGYGADLLARHAASVVGIDISEEAVEYAKATYGRPGLEFLRGSATEIPMPDDSFDVVVSFETIEHLAEQDGALAEMKRVLRPDGILIMSSPNRPVYSERPGFQNPFHVKEMDMEEFRRFLEREFEQVSLYSQSQVTGSMLFPNEGAEANLALYATRDSLTYEAETPISGAQYFIAIAADRDLRAEGASILKNEAYVPRLQQEVAWHAKRAEAERARAAAAEDRADRNLALTKRITEILAENKVAVERDIDTARAAIEKRLALAEKSLTESLASVQRNLHPKPDRLIAGTEQDKSGLFWRRLSALLKRASILLQYVWLQLNALLRYPLSRAKRRAFIKRRVETSTGDFAQLEAVLSERVNKARWRLKAVKRYPFSAKKRSRWRQANPYQKAPMASSAAGPAVLVAAPMAVSVPGTPVPDGGLHGRLFDSWVNNALGQYDGSEHVAIARFPPPSNLCDVRLIAYYLPQFHPIPENDAWWGKGFTEWRNVVRAFPNFEGHYQPRVPGELGFYDLRVPEVMQRQVELAKLYGISAFCFHFYWFGGKTLLERPIRSYLERKELDLPFCLCWANENWSRRWDGSEHEVLIAQKHSPEDDEAFLRYVEAYFSDDRYLKIDGKPVLTVYRPSILPDAKATTDRWRRLAREMGYPGLYLIATNAFTFRDYEALGFDALSEFPPHHVAAKNVQADIDITSLRTGWRVRLYSDVVASELVRDPGEGRIHPGIMMAWDNSARRPLSGEIIHGSTPALFRQWLRRCFARAHANPDGERLVFVNAWNEWAEGTYLEPDKRFGYAFLTACADEIRHDVNGVEPATEVIPGLRSTDPGAATILVCGHNAHAQMFGAERSLLDVLRAIGTAGHNIVVTLPATPHPDYLAALIELVCEVRIFKYAQWTSDTPASLDAVPEFIACIRDVRANLVYVNTIVLRAPLEAARLTGVPVIVHVRELILADHQLQDQIGLTGEEIIRFISRHSAHVIANSATTAASLLGHAPVEAVPNIVDLDAFDLPPASSDGLVRFALISSNLPKKGIDDVVELSRLCRDAVPRARFLVIGPTERPGIQEYLSGLRGIPSNLEFIEYLPSATDAIARADVVLNLSHFQESFGRTVLEAMAAGRPVIVYDWGALPELVEDGESGFVVPYRDLDRAAEAVKALVNPATLDRMATAAKMRAQKISDRSAHDAKIAHVLAKVLDQAAFEAGTSATSDVTPVQDVSIVICVHNALEDVRVCLASVDQHRDSQHRIILVDDGSETETLNFLQDFAANRDYVTLRRNETALGYTKAANIGASIADSSVIILLNSDTIVTPGWATKLVNALRSAPGAGIAGPLSNAASFQSVPNVQAMETQTAVNVLPEGWTPDDMNKLCEAHAGPHFPAVPLVHGFCFAMTREVWETVGPFDEVAFPRGFGEENDFCFRASDAGFGMIVATNTYVFHAKSKSYGEADRQRLVDPAQEILYERHGRKRFLDSVNVLDRQPELLRMRRAAALAAEAKTLDVGVNEI